MPILAVDQMGRIYQTSGDRADGLGFGSYPEVEGQSDCTLGSAYLKSQQRRTAELVTRKRNQAEYDRRERMMGAARREQTRLANHQALEQHRILQNPRIKNQVLKQGLAMGCACNDYNGPMGDNVMSANGLRGFAGMTRDQQVIHTEVLGMGASRPYGVDPVLTRQAQGRALADRMLRLKATPAARTTKTRV